MCPGAQDVVLCRRQSRGRGESLQAGVAGGGRADSHGRPGSLLLRPPLC